MKWSDNHPYQPLRNQTIEAQVEVVEEPKVSKLNLFSSQLILARILWYKNWLQVKTLLSSLRSSFNKIGRLIFSYLMVKARIITSWTIKIPTTRFSITIKVSNSYKASNLTWIKLFNEKIHKMCFKEILCMKNRWPQYLTKTLTCIDYRSSQHLVV